jgi:outer membrane translocation and assembly module TamA
VYLWRLLRLGGAAFVDVGRAWGGVLPNTANPGWLGDVGFGLRIVSERSSFGTVVHVDVAFPLNRADDISKVQLLVKAKRSF